MTTDARILVADDEPHLLRLVKFRLEREGYEVLTAADGEEALELARRELPDLCILDVMMPKRNGFDVLRELRADQDLRDVPVIVVTADVTQDHERRLRGAGATAYLTKPLDLGRLQEEIDRALGPG